MSACLSLPATILTTPAFAVWPVAAAANTLIALCYFAIAWVIARGLLATNQMRTNALGVATGMIFVTCAVHHGSHAVHLLMPLVTADPHGTAMRSAFGWQMAAWDIFGAAVAITYLNLRSSFGRLLQTPSMFEDMARARAVEAVAAERAALAEAQELGQMGSFRRDAQTGALDLSAEYERMFGFAEGQSHEAIWEWIHPEDVASVQAAMAQAQAEGQSSTVYRWRKPGGRRHWAQVRMRTERDDAGTVVALAGTVQDVTDHTLMEKALREAERRFRTAFDGAPIGATLVGLEGADRGRVRQCNPALAEMLGVSLEDLTGQPISAITHPDDYPQLEEALAALAAGGTDFELERRLMHQNGHFTWVLVTGALLEDEQLGAPTAVVYVVDISERKQFEGQLQFLADHDALTGLHNRRRFIEELERAIKSSRRYGDPGAVLFLDLDGFKFVNDSLGHAAGDDLITGIGALLAGTIRETDMLARVGGDEFAVLLPRGGRSEAELVAEKILVAVRQRAIAVVGGRHARVSISIGIATFDDGAEQTADELLVEADIAMYQAKELGRDRFAVYEPGEHHRTRMVTRENWNQRLRSALANDGFVLHAQPIVAIGARDAVPSYELLLRLPDDHGDLIPPGTFLYNAERFGLIEQIDRWVLREGVRLLCESHAAGVDLQLSVNVSGKSMGDPNLATYVAQLLMAHPVHSERLVIEITETAAITNVEGARTLARKLRELGCLIALDDFGAGFASFYYLKHLGFDFLKIDGEFIRSLCTTPTDELVVHAVVDIARGLGANTIAEFVGDEPTRQSLKRLGVDFGQGYYLGRPGPLDERLPHLMAAVAAREPTVES